MKFAKSVTFRLDTIDVIDQYMQNEHMKNFSKAVNDLILEGDRFKKIALKLQKKDDNKL